MIRAGTRMTKTTRFAQCVAGRIRPSTCVDASPRPISQLYGRREHLDNTHSI